MVDIAYDVVGIGNAIVDVLAHADDAFLDAQGLHKGTMALIDTATAQRVYAEMGPAVEVSGGSVANSIAGLAGLGGRGAFIGKVSADQLGEIFRHDMTSLGVAFPTPPLNGGQPTGRCLILVTPDAQRTMQTFLGASGEIGPEDVDADVIARSRITYLEGYLWDMPRARDAFNRAAEMAHAAGRKVALSLSDPFCVERHRAQFAELVDRHIDILFANEDEIVNLYQVHSFQEVIERVRHHCEVAVLTRSEKGSVVVNGDDALVVAAEPATRVIDTTGAGDSFAAGFLYGVTQGYSYSTCARIGSIVAAEVIAHVGARPEIDLKALLHQKLS